VNERRRGNLDRDDFATYAEMREALQKLYDHKARSEPWLRFWESMRLLKVEELLPQVLKDENVREVLRQASSGHWRRWTRLAIAVGILASFATLTSMALDVWVVLHTR
jgi:hypothetical protein